ncbi:MAG TPA: extracellular solute-binding protein [Arenibaculum sp.]|nr:extracellular solute-binding protein [Arenibaculum sp.]
MPTVLLRLLVLVPLLAGLAAAPGPAGAATGAAMADEPATRRLHAVAEFASPRYPADFRHFDYVDPDAPKGGGIVLAEPGTFDSLNPIPLRGTWPRSIGLAYDTLFTASEDEIGVSYGLAASEVEVPDDLSWAIFHLRPQARWHDGEPITAADFVFAWNAIQDHGRPFLKSFLERVESVEALDDHRLRATFSTKGEIKPLAQLATTLSPEPEHWWTQPGRDIAATTLAPPLTSGPYRIAAVDPGRSVTYERVADYWGRDLPVNVGQHNFDTIRYDFYRDDDVMFEAFRGGAYDLREENRAQRWVTGYDAAIAEEEGRLKREALPNERPIGAQGIRFNTRRPRFADPRVRQALTQLYDFEWIRRNLLYGQYERVESNFPNSDFGARGLPDERELALLEPWRGRIPDEVFTTAYHPPAPDGSGKDRRAMREALRLFEAAGWTLDGGRLVNAAGERFRIEFLENSPAMVRVLQPYVTQLRQVGIQADIRVVDSAQYQVRTDEFDFDAVMVFFNFFPPPGTELRSYFGSQAAATKGSANYAGIDDPAVDQLTEAVIAAPDAGTLIAATRALDRVLLWGHYMVPQWYNGETWIAYWDKFGRPETKPRYSTGFPSTWWHAAAATSAHTRSETR